MLRNKKLTILFLLSLAAFTLLATACSPSKAEQLNKKGNDAFTEQAFQESLVAYQTAQIEEPELAEPYYNAANALYRQGAYADALKQLEMALSFADQEELAQAGLYNLGNNSYNQQDLQTAVASYTESLMLDPADQDAKYNLELALQQLQQQQNEEQQQEDQQQEESQGDESQEEQQDQGSEGEQEEQQEQPEQGQQEEQESQSEEGQESDQGQEGEKPQEEESQEPEGEQGEGEQEEQQGQPQEGQPDEAQDQEGQLNELPAPGQRMTEEQAEQLLAAIARDGQTLQEKLGQIFAVPWAPPVQDW